MKREVQFQFTAFKQYAHFILEDQGLQKELADAFLEQIRNSHFPRMHFLVKLSSSQSQPLFRENLKSLLVKSLDDTAFESALAKINAENDQHHLGHSRRALEKFDLLNLFGIQKQLLIKFLNRFTQDIFTFSKIAHELEDFHKLLEEQILDAENLHLEERITTLLQRREGEKHLLSLLDALPVKIGFIRTDRTVGFINTAYADFFHLKKEEVEGLSIENTFVKTGFVNQELYLERALKGELVKCSSESEFSGSKLFFTTTFIPKKVNNVVDGIFLIAEDVTELRAIQEQTEGRLHQLKESLQELEKTNIRLQKTNDELGSFVYSVSHDLRTPVASLDGLLQIIRERFMGRADAEETRMLKMTELAAGRLKKTIDDLLEVVKAQKEANSLTIDKDAVRFPEVVKAVKEDLHSLIVENHALIVEDYKVEEIYCRTANLRSIVYNLISNAVKYGSPDRPLLIEMATYTEGEYVALSVKDNGIGMSCDQLPDLFSTFNRMHQQVEGIGIGLYSIKRIVESIGGKIDVKSEEGKGSEFLVYLPN